MSSRFGPYLHEVGPGRAHREDQKNQTYLTSAEWDHFICAYQDITPGFLKGMDKPSLDDFADEHAAFKDKNHGWYVLGAALFRLAPGVLKCL